MVLLRDLRGSRLELDHFDVVGFPSKRAHESLRVARGASTGLLNGARGARAWPAVLMPFVGVDAANDETEDDHFVCASFPVA